MHHNPALAALLKRIKEKQAQEPSAPPHPSGPLTYEDVVKMYGDKAAPTTKAFKTSLLRRKPAPDALSEIARAALLKNVIDALVARCNSDWSFNVWHKHGLSRIYFSDDSWLSYSPEGVCIFGPDKSGTAYQIRSELGLKKPAIRSVVL